MQLSDVGTYDGIIAGHLLNADPICWRPKTQLPRRVEAPVLAAARMTAAAILHRLSETDIQLLADNGFNFPIFSNFSTLRFPWTTTETAVNAKQAVDLDQLIAWGMEYGVHSDAVSFFWMKAAMTKHGDSIAANDAACGPWYKTTGPCWHDAKGDPQPVSTIDLSNEIQPGRRTILCL